MTPQPLTKELAIFLNLKRQEQKRKNGHCDTCERKIDGEQTIFVNSKGVTNHAECYALRKID